jgi:subtilisin family serine protease
MSTINTQFFSPQALKSIRDAVNGNSQEGSIRATALDAPLRTASLDSFNAAALNFDDSQDVLIMAPTQGIFKSDTAIDVSDTLSAKGHEVKDDLENLGATARLSQDNIAKLKEEGYQVFDNSPRPLWNGLPKVTQAPGKPGDYSMPKVNPTGWLKSDQLNASGLTGAGQTVAVLDSGFDHPQFQLKAWVDVVNGSATPVDKVGHGTHVAHDVLQAAPDADIVAVKVMGDDGSGRPSDIIKGLLWVVQQKLDGKLDVDVINMSLGGGPDGYPDNEHPINRAVELATQAGITVVAAAGNSGPDGNTIGSPAESANAIAVGSVLHPGQLSEFSSRGPTEDGLTKPDVLAPGEFIAAWSVAGSEMEQTARAVETLRSMPADKLKLILERNPELREGLGLPEEILSLPADQIESIIKPNLPPTYIPAEGLVAAPGTSFAAPLVAGVLASLEQGRDISPEQSMALLRGTAQPLSNLAGNEQGAGFVDAKRAQEKLAAV